MEIEPKKTKKRDRAAYWRMWRSKNPDAYQKDIEKKKATYVPVKDLTSPEKRSRRI